LRTANDISAKELLSWHHCTLSMAEARGFDIVHNHAGEPIMALHQLCPEVPMLTTMHCLIAPEARPIWDGYGGHYNNISWAQKRGMPGTGGIFAGVVYNAIDVRSFPFQKEKQDYLLSLSRISPEKGPHIAVDVAHRVGLPLIIAGKVDQADAAFYRDTVEPLIDGTHVRFLGEADAAMKRELYRNARALLVPITWDEPFGLVLAEAQACGTPVITFNRGAAPEIVIHERTGFIVDGPEAMADAVSRVHEIDPLACREHVARRFDGPAMAANYVRLYGSILAPRLAPVNVVASQYPDSRQSVQVA
jgi:glycosyltransferase involved in cell wall biosynthesis